MQEVERREAEALVCACLRGEEPAWPARAGRGFGEVFLEQCNVHGVAALVYHRLDTAPDWPRETVKRLRDRSVAAAAWELHHRAMLGRLLADLAARGIIPVLLKGTPLAYTCYADPALRTRCDTDLLIPQAARDEAHPALRSVGFDRDAQVSGELISYQANYRARDPLGLVHLIDVHWRISNSEVLARLFDYSDLEARAVPVPALAPEAYAACPVDALLIACMHREAHRESLYRVGGIRHSAPDRLIWLYDLHVLAKALSPQECAELVRRARRMGLSATCREGIMRTAELLGTPVPSGLLEALATGPRPEGPRAYLRAGALGRQYMDFRALPGLGPRLRFLRELVFPPASYMRARYAGVRPSWLPWLYARRALAGSARRLRSAWLRG